MSARPGRWELLGVDGDPLPGDCAVVSGDVKHYNQTAERLRDQVARLRDIASGSNDLVGKYAPELEKGAEDLADDLEKATGRFDTVAAQLGRWEPVLDEGRSRTARFLTEAEEAQSRVDATAAPNTPVDPADDAATAAEARRKTAHTDATGELAGVVRRFTSYLDGVQGTAREVARAISDAAEDKLKNHRFDGLRKWVHDHADLLKAIADALTVLATVIVVAVLLLSNPAGWLVLVAMGLTLGAMLIHTTLAAQGDGSWVDVGLDAFALLTMGGGSLLGGLAKGARSARLVFAGIEDGATAFRDATVAARTAFAEAGRFSKPFVWLARSNPLMRTFEGVAAFGKTYAATMARALPENVSILSRFAFGEKETAAVFTDIKAMQQLYGSGFLLDSAETLLRVKSGLFISGSLVDLGGKFVNPLFPRPGQGPVKPPWTGFSEWAEEHTVSSSEGG